MPLSPANYIILVSAHVPRKNGHGRRFTRSFCSAVKTHICLSVTFVHCINCWRHCMTDTDDVQSTRHDFLIVQAAVMPTKVFPAPHGSTMIPDRARLDGGVNRPAWQDPHTTHPFPNILLSDLIWYGRIFVAGLRSISKLGLIVSL